MNIKCIFFTLTPTLAASLLTVLVSSVAMADDQSSRQNNPPPNVAPNDTQTRGVNSQNQSGQISADDSKFLQTVATDGAEEVALGRLAMENGSTDAVKRYGQRIVEDHEKANRQLQDIASRKGVTLPAEPTTEEKKTIEKLRASSGQEFDNEFVNIMAEKHKKDLEALKQASASANDPGLKNYAASNEPVIKEHLKTLESIPTSSKRTPAEQ